MANKWFTSIKQDFFGINIFFSQCTLLLSPSLSFCHENHHKEWWQVFEITTIDRNGFLATIITIGNCLVSPSRSWASVNPISQLTLILFDSFLTKYLSDYKTVKEQRGNDDGDDKDEESSLITIESHPIAEFIVSVVRSYVRCHNKTNRHRLSLAWDTHRWI